jgi:AcrR family transcriptional regulator
MPRITEPTVAEHRARQLRTLLDAGRAIVAEEGPDALTLSALARRVGRSRASLYEYFRSRDDLVAAMLEDEMPAWSREIEDRVGRATTLDGKVEAFVRVQLELLADGGHAAMAALSSHVLGGDARDRVRDEHALLMRPLEQTLTEAGLTDVATRAALIQGTVNGALPLLRAGDRRHNQAVIRATVAQVLHGLDGA